MEFNDFLVKKISLLVSLAGIILLLFLAFMEEPLEISPGEIDESWLDKRVISQGKVGERFFANDTLFFSLGGEGGLRVVVFSPTVRELAGVRENEFVRIRGVVKKYKGQLEIIAEEVESVD
ncbi:MAG: OB-fold nucleic acid binding domain-containing protein [Candidatus Diapherotrites archaeon]